MRIAVICPANMRLAETSLDLGLLVRGFRDLGHDAFAVCPARCEVGFHEPVVTVPGLESFESVEFCAI